MNPSSGSSVAILLATKNGERFLAEQLDSISAQTHSDWKVWASDDGSGDRTLEILQDYARRWNQRLMYRDGPRRGAAANFLSLVCSPEIESDYFAFSDQDDIWEPGKLETALLELMSRRRPALFCSRTRFVDASGRLIRLSPIYRKPPSFRNALVQNICSGNTIVMNRAARDLLAKAGVAEVVIHDWWAYLLVTGAGGEVLIHDAPLVRHRQHDSNTVFRARSRPAQSAMAVFDGRLRSWIDQNIRELNRVRHLLTPEHRQLLEGFSAVLSSSGLRKAAGLLRSDARRQSRLEDFAVAAGLSLARKRERAHRL